MPSPVTTLELYDGCSPGTRRAYGHLVDPVNWPPCGSHEKPSATFSKAMDPLT